MKTGVQTLVNEVIGYGMGTAVNRTIGLIVAFIYPLLLNRDEYGRMDVIYSAPGLLIILFPLGLDSTLTRFFYADDDVAKRRRLVSTIFYTVITLSVLVSGILLAASQSVALSLYGDPRYVPYFRLVLIAVPFIIAGNILTAVLRLERRVHLYNSIISGSMILSALVGIGSILTFHIGVAGALLGFLAGHVAISIAALIISRQYLFAAPMPGRLPELLGFGLPLMFSGIAFWFIGSVNRPMLANQVSADEVGLFAIASGGVNVMALLIGAFRNAWQPFAFSIMGQEDSGRVYGRTLTIFTSIAATIAVCGALFAPQALVLMNAYTGKDWSGAAASVGPLAMGILFFSMYFVVQTGIYIARRTNVIAWTVGIAAVASIFFNALLIPAYGIVGAAVATALGNLTALLLLYRVAQRIAPVPYQPAKLTATVLLATAVLVLNSRLQTNTMAQDLAIKTALLLAYGAALPVCRILTFKDLALIRDGIRSALLSIRARLSAYRKGLHADSD